MYLSISIGMFSDLSRPMIRAILSKAVPEKDTGINFVSILIILIIIKHQSKNIHRYIFKYMFISFFKHLH